MRSPRLLAVDIGASHVACGVFARGAGGQMVLQYYESAPCAVQPGTADGWSAAVSRVLRHATAHAKSASGCAVALPGHLTLTKRVKTPSVPAGARAQVAAFEAAENIPHPLEAVAWDWEVAADDGSDLELLLAAAKNETIGAVCAAVESAGFRVERIVPSAVTLHRAFRLNHPGVTEPALVASIGARSTQLLLAAGGHFHVRTIALGGDRLTQAIADELRGDFSAAEKLKLAVLSGRSDLPAEDPAREIVRRAVLAFAEKIRVEIARTRVDWQRQAGAGAPAALWLAGGGAQIPGLAASLEEKLQLPALPLEPFGRVELSADARAAGADTAAPMLADLVGLAAGLGARDGDGLNLLPRAAVAADEARARRPWWLAAAALGLATLVPPIWHFHRVAESNRAAIASVEARLAPLRETQRRNADNLQRIEAAQRQIAALSRAHRAKAGWSEFLAALQGGLARVEDAWLDELRVVRPPEPATGGSAPSGPPPMKVTLSGRMLERENPPQAGADSFGRARRLLEGLGSLSFVAAVESERFDRPQPGLLRFDVTLVLAAENPL